MIPLSSLIKKVQLSASPVFMTTLERENHARTVVVVVSFSAIAHSRPLSVFSNKISILFAQLKELTK